MKRVGTSEPNGPVKANCNALRNGEQSHAERP
jgi:hypothetical protein